MSIHSNILNIESVVISRFCKVTPYTKECFPTEIKKESKIKETKIKKEIKIKKDTKVKRRPKPRRRDQNLEGD